MSVGDAAAAILASTDTNIGGGGAPIGVGMSMTPPAAVTARIQPPHEVKQELEISSPKRRKAEENLRTRRKRDLHNVDTRPVTSSSTGTRVVALPVQAIADGLDPSQAATRAAAEASHAA